MDTDYSMITIDEQVALMAQRLIGQLREARYRQRASQSELAEGSDMSRSVIARFEAGKSNPTLLTLLTIVAALGVELVVKESEDSKDSED